MSVIENKIFDNKKAKKIVLENKEFVNCSFSGFDCFVFARNVIFRNCIFDNCSLICSFDKVKIINGQMSKLDIYRSHINNSVMENCLIEESSLSNSFTSLSVFKHNKVEDTSFVTVTTDNLKSSHNEFKNISIYCSSFLASEFSTCEFKEIFSTVKKNYFDNCCSFENIDFSMVDKENSIYSRNIILGTFKNCQNKDHLGLINPCPEKGSFIGYKKCWYRDEKSFDFCIVTLKICADAKRIGQNGSRKCRCSKAEVLSIETMDGKVLYDTIAMSINHKFTYEVGKIVEPANGFNENEEIECSSGIHFFMTKREAVNYEL